MAAFFSLATILAVAAVQALAFPAVIPEEEPLALWQEFREAVLPQFTPRAHASEMGVTVTKFKWSNCGRSNDPIRIISLDVQENLVFSMTVDITETITAPVKLEWSIAKKIGLIYVHIPCSMIDIPCVYPDACKTWSDLMPVCHEDIINNDLPCSCPVYPGRYSVVDLDVNLGDINRPRTQQTFQVDLKEYLPMATESKAKVNGDYKMEITLSKAKKRLICAATQFTMRYSPPY
ncbi:hypothetical protein RvY_16499 [Ramazzottius varieornatus]|uniref:MD-2-related lipid-recognition domain-containing protein n=1 Tax=Ramazzottius varieornatus TaxID=947166 RepID=A0A1D1VYP1_RAMVA|nr:hypothetical protein RvY_16499 [Ramazzottius varieornatus]